VSADEVEGGEAELVDDDRVEAYEGVDVAGDAVVGDTAVEGLDEVGRREVADPHACCDCGVAGGDEKVGLPVPARPTRHRFSFAVTHSREVM
jgi:hypothetical protein